MTEKVRSEKALNLAEEMDTQGGKDENNRVALIRGLTRLNNYIDEEDAAKDLLKDVPDKKKQQEEEYMTFWDPAKRRTGTFCVPTCGK